MNLDMYQKNTNNDTYSTQLNFYFLLFKYFSFIHFQGWKFLIAFKFKSIFFSSIILNEKCREKHM